MTVYGLLLSYNILSPKNELAFGLVGAGMINTGGSFNAALTSTEKYNYATSSSGGGTVLSSVRGDGVGASTLDLMVGISGTGGTGAGYYFVPSTSRYTYSGDTSVASSNIITNRQGAGGSGISSLAIIGAGGIALWGLPEPTTASTEKYTYSSGTFAGGTTLTSGKSALVAAGNDTFCLFGPGKVMSTFPPPMSSVPRFNPVNATTKYNYSNDTVAAGTVFPSVRAFSSAVGTITTGIWCGGGGGTTASFVSTSIKYTYSNDIQAAGGNLPSTRAQAATNSNKTLGILSGGTTNGTAATITNVVTNYTFASDGALNGGNLSVARASAIGGGSSPSAFLT